MAFLLSCIRDAVTMHDIKSLIKRCETMVRAGSCCPGDQDLWHASCACQFEITVRRQMDIIANVVVSCCVLCWQNISSLNASALNESNLMRMWQAMCQFIATQLSNGKVGA